MKILLTDIYNYGRHGKSPYILAPQIEIDLKNKILNNKSYREKNIYGGVYMTLNLTQKERMLLEDQKSHEELCIKKYNDYASKAQSQELKQLFGNYAMKEQEHLNSLNQILNGQVPQMNQQQGQQQQGQQQQQSISQKGNFMNNSGDKDLCSDMLIAEKYVSNAYDTAVFEMTDKNVRQVLNHIQKEEQEHGEGIYNYMSSNGMYNVK